MNLETKSKAFILVILSIPILMVGYNYYKKESFKVSLFEKIKQNHSNPQYEIAFKELTIFNWDFVTWIYHGDSYGSLFPKIGNVLRFYKGDKLVAEINLEKKYPQVGTYKNCGCPDSLLYSAICFTPETAIFKIRGNSHSGLLLKSSKCD